MIKTYLIILILAFISGFSTIIGAGLAFIFKKCPKAISMGLGFAAGIMLLISFFELIPESTTIIGIKYSLLSMFTGIVVTAILNSLIPHTHLCKTENKLNLKFLKTAYLCAIGLIMHDFPEGFAMANSYLHSPKLGLLVTLTIALHNIPEEFALTLPFLLSKKSKKFILKMAFVSGLAEPAGAILGLVVVSIMPKLNPYFLSLAAGIMIFVSLHELIPLSIKNHKKITFLTGFAFSILVYLVLKIFFPE